MVHFSSIGALAIAARLAVAQTTTADIFYPFNPESYKLEGYIGEGGVITSWSMTSYTIHCVAESTDSGCDPTPIIVVEGPSNAITVTSSTTTIVESSTYTCTALASCGLYGTDSSPTAGCIMNYEAVGDINATIMPSASRVSISGPRFQPLQTLTITPAPATTTPSLPAQTTMATTTSSKPAANTASTSTSIGGMPMVTGNARLALGGAAVAAMAMFA